jgi:predicted transcriptional regulator of viral defense system
MTKYAKLVREHFKGQPVFSLSSLRVFLAKKGPSKNYSNLLVHNLLRRGEIQRIAKGVYSFQSDASVAGFAFSPFYYGLQEALSLRNLWEQETNPVIITPKKVRPGVRRIMGSNVLVRRIKRKMFFGFDLIKHYDFWIPVSDAEKTIIDFNDCWRSVISYMF